jgi:GMP synthase (glutamine-hydrolysing)
VVLGGGFMCDDDVRAPWLPATRALVHEALDDGTPILGICLGGQLLAHVAGGAVTPDAGAPEHGSTPITIRPEAEDDPLFRDLPATVPAVEHHKDAITTLPPGAVWLASTERCQYQAFRVGNTAWGVQFHPEVGPDRLLQWDAAELELAGLDRDALHRQAVTDDPVAAPIWERVTRRFAAMVGVSARVAKDLAARTD